MLNVPLIKQKTGYTCGPTCIAMLAGFFNMPLSWRKIMRVSHCDRDGMTNEDFIHALEKLHFLVSAGDRNSWNDLRENYRKRLPTVIAWMLHGHIGHFSIVVEVGKNYVILADPDTGKNRRLPKDVFLRLWFDYDGTFFPTKTKNLHLRWAATVRGIKY